MPADPEPDPLGGLRAVFRREFLQVELDELGPGQALRFAGAGAVAVQLGERVPVRGGDPGDPLRHFRPDLGETLREHVDLLEWLLAERRTAALLGVADP